MNATFSNDFAQIINDYVAKVKPEKHSLISPLEVKAILQFQNNTLSNLKGKYTLVVLDISEKRWEEVVFI